MRQCEEAYSRTIGKVAFEFGRTPELRHSDFREHLCPERRAWPDDFPDESGEPSPIPATVEGTSSQGMTTSGFSRPGLPPSLCAAMMRG